jgi:hypothetical protein
MKNVFKYFVVCFIVGLIVSPILSSCGCNSKDDLSKLPESKITYLEADAEIGRNSDNSEPKKDDIFKKNYKDHWFTWEGEVLKTYDESVKMNISGFKDLHPEELLVYFADEKSVYDIKVGQIIKVKFLMYDFDTLLADFAGNEGVLVK